MSKVRSIFSTSSRALPYRSPTPSRYPARFIPRIQYRTATRLPFPGGGGPQYSRFNRGSGLRSLWQQSPAFRYGAGASAVGAGVFYVSNLEEVPVSGRRRFNCISPDTEIQIAKGGLQQVLQQFKGKLLPPRDPRSKLVRKVLNRLIPVSGIQDSEWETFVIDDPDTANAFVLPGGKVFVFSGILPICDGEDGLAAVLGHEIAHNVAHHSAENMSRQIIVLALVLGLSIFGIFPDTLSRSVADLALFKPGSRKQESEADYIGLLMMAEACYDPSAATGLWQRMEKAEKYAPPQWMSTHPSSHNRVQKITEWYVLIISIVLSAGRVEADKREIGFHKHKTSGQKVTVVLLSNMSKTFGMCLIFALGNLFRAWSYTTGL